jgi:hypothetical protein
MRKALSYFGIALALLSVIAAGLAAPDAAIVIETPMTPPRWALLERELLRANSEAVEFFADRYIDDRGYLLHTPRWGTLDGPDDAIETYLRPSRGQHGRAPHGGGVTARPQSTCCSPFAFEVPDRASGVNAAAAGANRHRLAPDSAPWRQPQGYHLGRGAVMNIQWFMCRRRGTGGSRSELRGWAANHSLTLA